MTKRLRRFEPRLNAGEGVVSIVLLRSTARVVNVAEGLFTNRAGAVSPPYSAPSGRSVEEGGLAPSPQKLIVGDTGFFFDLSGEALVSTSGVSIMNRNLSLAVSP